MPAPAKLARTQAETASSGCEDRARRTVWGAFVLLGVLLVGYLGFLGARVG
jgi:hypothetical protein